jgi:Xaa-Pro aminopeptidase
MTDAEDTPPYFQTDFSPTEFNRRREAVAAKIGAGVAVLQGLPDTGAFAVFRQHNDFLYLCGVESPHAYLVIDGQSGRSILYLLPRDEKLAASEGAELNADDADVAQRITGVDEVRSTRTLLADLPLHRPIYLCNNGAEGRQACQDTLRHAKHKLEQDSGREAATAETRFANLLRTREADVDIRNLTPILAAMRLFKSPAELRVMRRAGEICGRAVEEAMRCTEPGMFEYELGAVAEYVFLVNGAQGGGYRPIIAGGANIWNMHYWRNNCRLNAGELVLMDYAPDVSGYTSDIGRMWPVNGKYDRVQRDLYGFVVDYHATLLEEIRPGATPAEITRKAAERMKPWAARTKWTKPIYEAAIARLLDTAKPCTHPVGMAVHDVGTYQDEPLRPGIVFALDPQLWAPEERLYIRVEDCVAVTASGVESLTRHAPLELDEVERIIGTGGIVQSLPPVLRPEMPEPAETA